MKKNLLFIAAAAFAFAACGSNKAGNEDPNQYVYFNQDNDAPEYIEVLAPEFDIKSCPQDADGYYVIFNGEDFTGWRGYGKDHVPSKWTVEDGCIKFNGTGGGEAQEGDGGDIIFTNRLHNFVFEFDWKVDKGSNSGVFFYGREIMTTDAEGNTNYEPIYLSSPEYQILDNANHPDANFGVDGNRRSASLYDMIPAVPQNQNPWGEWNHGSITVYEGTVVHAQNGVNVVEYHLWTPRWIEMLQASKFSQEAWPIAFDLLSNCGGPDKKGYLGFQDHGDVVWYKNIRVKIFD